MMRRIVSYCVALVVITFASGQSEALQGSWTSTIEKEHPGKLYFSLRTGRNDQHGSLFERSAFEGLSSADIESKSRVPVRFELRGEAGTLSFEGSFRDGRGGGDFTFVSNSEFQETLERYVAFRIFDVDPKYVPRDDRGGI